MVNHRALACTALALAALAAGFPATSASAAAARTAEQQVESFFDPEEDTRHPTTLAMAMVLNEDHPRGATVCVSYSHARSAKPNRGLVEAELRIFRAGRLGPGSERVVELDFGRMKVRGGQAVDCRPTGKPLEDGDGLEVVFRFKRRPPIRAAGGESAGVTASVRKPGVGKP